VVNHPNRSKQPRWRPIETAPRDGTTLDLWAYFPEHDKARRIADAFWNTEENAWQLGGFNSKQFSYPPTISHWMPLPAAPPPPSE
jgi:hypothetical protein